MKLDDIKRVLVVGAGTMGQQIGLQCALYGYDVTLHDISQEVLDDAMARVAGYAAQMVEERHIKQRQADAALARITATVDAGEAASEADLISESVPEDPGLKGKVFAQFNTLCPARTIFTTNTSSLIPSMFAEATGRPAQFLAFHFHQPVWQANVADVMPHPGTSDETVALVEGFARRIGQIPIVLHRENYGYVFNAMYNALNTAAISLAARGVATVEDIDRAWMVVMKSPFGPLGTLDVVGLDTAWHITNYWAEQLDDKELKKNAAFLKEYVDAGRLGVKSGQGFYSYPDPAYLAPGFIGEAAPIPDADDGEEVAPVTRAPDVTLVAAGSGRAVKLDAAGVRLVLLCHTADTSAAASAANRALREAYPLASDVLIANVVVLKDVPKMFRKMAENALRKSYDEAVAGLPEGISAEDYVIILPDWDGSVVEGFGLRGVGREVGLVVLDGSGGVLGISQGDDLMQAARGFLGG